MDANTASNSYWYESENNEDMARQLFSQVKFLRENQLSSVSDDNLMHVRLYGNAEIFGLKPYDYSFRRTDNRIGLNVIKQACDTATSRIAKAKPRPQFLTKMGDYSLKQEAKKLQMYIDGTFYENKAYKMGQDVFKDATIVGKGVVKFFPKKTCIGMERVFVDEIIVDQAEAMYGNPSIIYQVKPINRRILLGMFPKKATYIKQAPHLEDATVGGIKLSEMVEVVEAWKLPSSPDSNDGLHIICTEKGVLFKEEWLEDWFPFSFFDWSKKVFGFYSSGIAEELRGIQLEINKLLVVIQRSMHLGSIPKIFVDANTKIVKSHLNNEIGGIITYAGTKPTYDQLMAIPPVLFEQLANLYQKAFEVVGLSQMSAHGQIPAGMMNASGKALRTYNDIETERFSVVAQNYDEFFLDMANKLILMSEREAKRKGSKLKVTSFNSKYIEDIEWKDIDIKRDQYILKTFPTNFLSATPEAKLADIQEMIGIGLLDQRDAMQLLDYPDLESVTEFKNAAYDDIHAVLENIIDKGQYEPPMPLQALEYGQTLFQQVYLKLKNQNLAPERLEMLLRWTEEAKMMTEVIAQEAMMKQQEQINMQAQQQALMPEQSNKSQPVR